MNHYLLFRAYHLAILPFLYFNITIPVLQRPFTIAMTHVYP